jgi:hypothetical protein
MIARVPERHCLSCGKRLNSASVPGSEDPTPEPGNSTICLYCGHLMVFAEDMSLRALTDAEMVELAGDPQVLEVMRFIEAYKRYVG